MSAPWYDTLTPHSATARLAASYSPKPLSMMWRHRGPDDSATPRPMPLVEPVTRAVFPFNMVVP